MGQSADWLQSKSKCANNFADVSNVVKVVKCVFGKILVTLRKVVAQHIVFWVLSHSFLNQI